MADGTGAMTGHDVRAFSGSGGAHRASLRWMDRGAPLRRMALVLGLAGTVQLGGCASDTVTSPGLSAAPSAFAPAVTAAQLTGAWGVGAFHKDEDRARTEKEARAQCSNPYVIKSGPNGGVIMHLADEKEPQELLVKVVDRRTFIGPAGPPGDISDREVIAFENETVLLTRFVDPEVAERYGTTVNVRCAPRAATRPAAPAKRS